MADFSVREAYLRFASREARGVSACYQQWAEGVASDAGLVARISQLTGIKRQPQLIFAAARLLGAQPSPFPVFRQWLLEHWDQVRAEALSRRNQMTSQVAALFCCRCWPRCLSRLRCLKRGHPLACACCRTSTATSTA